MIQIQNLFITFGNEHIYEDFSLNIKKGEKIAISGESGKGKSTFLNLLTGFISDFEGDVFVDGLELNPKNIYNIRKKYAWLPQETALNMQSVKDLFFTPFNFSLNKEKRPEQKQIDDIFTAFSLDESILDKKVKEISGGQKQRVLLASCVLQKKAILLLDEPSSALDKRIKKRVTDHILGLKNTTIIAVTHDEYWMKCSDKVISLDKDN